MTKVEIKPFKADENRYLYQVVLDGKPQLRFIQWIESIDNKISFVSGPSAIKVAQGCWNEDECQAHCNWLNDKIEKGIIK